MGSIMADSDVPAGLLNFTNKWIKEIGQNLSLSEALKETSAIWKALSEEERAKYNATKDVKTIASNTSIHDEDINESLMKDEISILLRVTGRYKDIRSTHFLFVGFNYFIVCYPEKLHMPAEVSVCAYSMEEGLIKLYSKHLSPKTDLYGACYLALEHSYQTHKLPIPPNAKGTSNLKAVYTDIIRFIKNYGGEMANDVNALPPLYTHNDQIPIVKSCLAYLRQLAPEQPELHVYSLQFLGEELISRTRRLVKKEGVGEVEYSEKAFEMDNFEYVEGIACSFHEEKDVVRYCTQHMVVRWCYTLSNFLCKRYHLKLVPMTHYPPKCKPINLASSSDDMDNMTDNNSSENECERNENTIIRKNLVRTDILKRIHDSLFQNREQKKVVSDVLISHWNTKPPGAAPLGFGRGHP